VIRVAQDFAWRIELPLVKGAVSSAKKPNLRVVSGLPLKHELLLNDIEKSSSYLTGNKHYVSATKPNRLMLFRETVAVYCENHTEHTDTLCGQNAEF
jgi:hypothetical protein